MDRPLEEYLKQADELAQGVVNAWGMFASAGHSRSFTSEFMLVFETTERYRTAKRTADNWRECGLLTEEMAFKEFESRLAFAKAYKAYRERHEKN